LIASIHSPIRKDPKGHVGTHDLQRHNGDEYVSKERRQRDILTADDNDGEDYNDRRPTYTIRFVRAIYKRDDATQQLGASNTRSNCVGHDC